MKQKEDGTWGCCVGWACWCQSSSEGGHLSDVSPSPVPPPAQDDQPGAFWTRRGGHELASALPLESRAPVPTTAPCAKCSPPKHKSNSKRGDLFLQNKLSLLFFFFPPAFTLKTFYLTKSQNDRSAFLIHFLCTALLAQHIPATSPCVNSLLNYSDQGF